MINKLLIPFFKQIKLEEDNPFEYKITSDKVPATSSFNANNNLIFLLKNKETDCSKVFSPLDYKDKDVTDSSFFMSCYLPFLIKRKNENFINILENYPGIVMLNYFRNTNDYDKVFFSNERDLYDFYQRAININWRLVDYKICLDDDNFKDGILNLSRFLKLRFDANFNTILNCEKEVTDMDLSYWVYCNNKDIFTKCLNTHRWGETPRMINTVPINDYKVEWIVSLEYTDLKTEVKYGIERLNLMMKQQKIGKEVLLTYLYLHNFVNSTRGIVTTECSSNFRKELEEKFSKYDQKILKLCDLFFNSYVKISSSLCMEDTQKILDELNEKLLKLEEN